MRRTLLRLALGLLIVGAVRAIAARATVRARVRARVRRDDGAPPAGRGGSLRGWVGS